MALLKGRKGGVDLPLKIIVNNLINEITPVGERYFLLWYVIVQLYDLERSFLYASVSKLQSVLLLEFKR